jgi:signal peptidase I
MGKKIIENLKKTWRFIWKDDSLLSWILSLLLAFIIVKFIFFPLLSLILATSLPLVVVESGSMHHPGTFIGNAIGMQENFDIWWENEGKWYKIRDIDKEDAESWPLKTGLEMGDIVLVTGHGNLEVGDIIIFKANKKYPIIHRIINITEENGGKIYSTKGDNNPGQLFTEKEIKEEAVVGKAVLKVPKLGWVKLGLVKIIRLF